MDHVQILIYDGFDELDAIAPYEVLAGAGVRTELVTLEPAGEVLASHGARIVPHGTLARSPDLLIVPGGGWRTRATVGTWGEFERGVLPAAIAERHAAGSTIASVCTGAMLLAKAGLLAGRPATTHHVAFDDLRAAGADVREDARVVDDGEVITCGGVTSGIDMALHVLRRERGEVLAAAAARLLEHDPRGPVLVTATAA
jgi:transcriptional regulator GlxA family with amidase domain